MYGQRVRAAAATFFVLCPPHWVLARSEVNVNPGLLDVLTGGANFSWQVLTVLGPPS